MAKKKTKFLRTGYSQYSKLGLRRKNKQIYRKSKGGENKIRLKMKGHLRNVSIGFRNEKSTRDLVDGKKPVRIFSIEGLNNLKKDEIAIVAKLGQKKRIEIAEYALKNNIRLSNLNSKKFIEKVNEEKKKSKEEKIENEEKKKLRDKKAKEAEKKKEEGDKKTEEKKSETKEIEKSVTNTEIKTEEAMADEPKK